ncbi:hypothetical protein QTP88_024458 [Uroleucon formosanum]
MAIFWIDIDLSVHNLYNNNKIIFKFNTFILILMKINNNDLMEKLSLNVLQTSQARNHTRFFNLIVKCLNIYISLYILFFFQLKRQTSLSISAESHVNKPITF